MMSYVKNGLFAVAAVWVAFQLPVVGDMLKKEAQKPPAA